MSGQKLILVAGGAGFVGSHLCEALIKRGARVLCLDNFLTGNKKNIRRLLKNPRFKFVKADITNMANLKKVQAESRGIGEIYHLASPASPPRYQSMPIETWKANTLGTLNLLELAKRHKAKFLFASTSEVYGDPVEHPQKESYRGNVNPIGIRACYDESKRAGETLCMDYRRLFGLDVKIIRIFNTYGPRMDKNDGRVVSNFIVQALNGRPLTVYGTGRQTRSFQYIDDLAAAVLKMMAAKNFAGPVNLGNPTEVSVLGLAKKIIKLAKSSSRIVYKPLPEDDPKQRKPEISLAKRKLGWEPRVGLTEGLVKTINYFSRYHPRP